MCTHETSTEHHSFCLDFFQISSQFLIHPSSYKPHTQPLHMDVPFHRQRVILQIPKQAQLHEDVKAYETQLIKTSTALIITSLSKHMIFTLISSTTSTFPIVPMFVIAPSLGVNSPTSGVWKQTCVYSPPGWVPAPAAKMADLQAMSEK